MSLSWWEPPAAAGVAWSALSPANPFKLAAFAARSVLEAGQDIVRPRVRLGVTGLSRSGKTVFTTAMVHQLMEGGRLPVLSASAQGRISRVRLEEQPDDDVPRFPYESHLAALTGPERVWPQSTTRISELRLAIEFERATGWRKGPSRLLVDIVDYPGEWLLDLALLDRSYAEWSRDVLGLGAADGRRVLVERLREGLSAHSPDDPADDAAMEAASDRFRAYLRAVRDDPERTATVPPGRFLMPGDLEGSPALTFAPLVLPPGRPPFQPGSLGAAMERRYNAYRSIVAEPFFRDHFSRLDRQIVLVDVLSALDGGPSAVADLERSLDEVLAAFRTGRNTFATALFTPRADRVLFAATKADHLHHAQHDRLEAILSFLVARAMKRTAGAGGKVATVALAAVRATREAKVRDGRQDLPTVIGTPMAGERVEDTLFDGTGEAALYSGELPEVPQSIFEGGLAKGSLRFPRLRPPLAVADAAGRMKPLPHIRLDRALEFLIGDYLA